MARSIGNIAGLLAVFGLLSVLEPRIAGAEGPAPSVSATPAAAACPATLPADALCYSGRSPEGAYYWIAMPKEWNGVLVMHAHGGPHPGKPRAEGPVSDLSRFAVAVEEGYAWAGSSYRRGGYGVRMAAEDTDILRRIVWQRFGKPRFTLLHGQSWGGNVAAKAAELYALDSDGGKNYDGVVLTSGVLAGGTKAYQFRAGLRAVYQYYCGNHPRPDEPAYPVWQGLPAGAEMRRKDIRQRVDECLGIDLDAAARTPEQQRKLDDILAVTGIGKDVLVSHLAWSTVLFQDLVQNRLDGRSPFSNRDTVYSGSHDDAALNAGVERFDADPAAVAKLAYDADMTGQIVLPTITLHAKADPIAFVWQEAAYREVIAAAGHSDLLVQTFTDEKVHSKLSTPQYAAIFDAMMQWLQGGQKPTPTSIAEQCRGLARSYDEFCRFDTEFVPSLPEDRPTYVKDGRPLNGDARQSAEAVSQSASAPQRR